jgi:hypothetical protein
MAAKYCEICNVLFCNMFHTNSSFFKICPLLITCLVVVVASSFKPDHPQAITFVQLQNQAGSIAPKEFYIKQIIDERTDKTTIGTVVRPNATTGGPGEAVKIDFEGGAAVALKNFVANSVVTNKFLRPVIIKLKTFTVTEETAPKGTAAGRIRMAVVFGYERDEDFIKLGDYSIISTYQRNIGPAQYVEPILRNTIVNSLTYINNWMDKQADTNIKLAKSVKVVFTNYVEQPEGDTIYYDINRPLKWDDFQLKPQNSRYAAEVFASLGYTEEVKVVKGVIDITLHIKVYLPKSASWARAEAMTNNSLTHEQHHFDIVKIVAEHFKRNILSEKLDPSNYDGPINVAYFDALREINVLQKQYDNETAHSTNAYQQQQWNTRV